MDRVASSLLAAQLAAAKDWWRDAGVDCAFSDEVTAWLRDEPAEEPGEQSEKMVVKPKAPEAPPIPAIGGDPAGWPQDCESFAAWWLSEPSLDAGGSNLRIAPRGKAGAKLMVLVPEPEAGDSDTLLSGPQGGLLASFFSAAGIDEAEAYVASALPRHTPQADWEALQRCGLGEVMLHHIGLARPERLLIFGRGVLPLLGHNPAQNPALLRKVNHQGGSVPALAARNLEMMLARPAERSKFWQHWLDWTDT